MQHRTLLAVLALLGSSALTLSPTAAPPVPGPGGVIDAVKGFLTAVDARDLATLRLIVDDQGDNLHDYATAGEASGKSVKASAAAFYDADLRGRPLQAGDKAEFLDALAVGQDGVTTKVLSVRANCLSERCSYAMVEYVRTHGEGDQAVAVPMRATALLRYAPSEGAPAFKIYHWHASPGPKPGGQKAEKQ